jgi:hypothetical protein
VASVSSLWIGSQLSLAHKIAISSFIYYGHSVKIYVYDKSIDVPPGAIKADANTIIKEKMIFKHCGSYAGFSDLFRYAMIAKTGETWVDADTFCFSDSFFEDQEYVFIKEADGIYAGGVLKAPANSDFIKKLYLHSKKISNDSSLKNDISIDNEDFWKHWSKLGPALLTEVVKELFLERFSIEKNIINLVDIYKESPIDFYWSPNPSEKDIQRINSAVAGTFFNSWLDQRGFDKNLLPEGSIMELFYKKFILHKQLL